jgi:hypothetical protein
MSDETQKPKVVTLGRTPYVPPPKAKDDTVIDEESLATVENVMAGIKEGKLVGVTIMAMNTDDGGTPVMFTNLPPQLPTQFAATLYIGLTRLLEDCFRDVAMSSIEPRHVDFVPAGDEDED